MDKQQQQPRDPSVNQNVVPRRLRAVSSRSVSRLRQDRNTDPEHIGQVARDLSAKWAARWGYAEEPLCDKCDLEGALERNERGEITKYCECPHGQRQKARAL